jgi:hypothetical protein
VVKGYKDVSKSGHTDLSTCTVTTGLSMSTCGYIVGCCTCGYTVRLHLWLYSWVALAAIRYSWVALVAIWLGCTCGYSVVSTSDYTGIFTCDCTDVSFMAVHGYNSSLLAEQMHLL